DDLLRLPIPPVVRDHAVTVRVSAREPGSVADGRDRRGMAVVRVGEPRSVVEETPEPAGREMVAIFEQLRLGQSIDQDRDDELRRRRRARARAAGGLAPRQDESEQDGGAGGLHFLRVYLIVRWTSHFPSCSVAEVKTLWSLSFSSTDSRNFRSLPSCPGPSLSSVRIFPAASTVPSYFHRIGMMESTHVPTYFFF